MTAPEKIPLSKGQKISMAIAAYMIVKPVFNWLFLGGSIAPLALGLIAMVCFYFGVKWSNTVIAVLLMLVACANMPTNIKNIGFNMFLIYLLEGLIDMVCAVILAFHREVRQHFHLTN